MTSPIIGRAAKGNRQLLANVMKNCSADTPLCETTQFQCNEGPVAAISSIPFRISPPIARWPG